MIHRPIPLTVIGGFLGSGKTTLVNHLLHDSGGLRIAVLVNDFGSINIDAQLIASTGANTIALTNGCVCCSIGDDLTDGLIRVIASTPAPDWIIIEASGVSDPWRIAEVALADRALMLEGVIVLIDGQAVMGYSADARLADTSQRQLSAADLMVLNKIDLMSSEQVAAVHAWLADQAPRAWIHQTREARVPHDMLRGPRSAGTVGSPSVDPALHRHGDPFCTWTFQTEELLSAEKLRRLLQAMPDGIVRAKGIVRTDAAPSRGTVFQFAGRSRYLKPADSWDGGASRIVFIGIKPAPAFGALRRLLREASVGAAEDAGHGG